MPFMDAFSNNVELVLVSLLAMIALLSSSAPPEADTSNKIEREQHAAFLLFWQILGMVVPVVVLSFVLRVTARILRERWTKKSKEANERTKRTRSSDGAQGQWVWVAVEESAESEDSSEDDEDAQRTLLTTLPKKKMSAAPAEPDSGKGKKGKGKRKGARQGGGQAPKIEKTDPTGAPLSTTTEPPSDPFLDPAFISTKPSSGSGRTLKE